MAQRTFTLADIKRSPCAHRNQHLFEPQTVRNKKEKKVQGPRPGDKQKGWIKQTLGVWCQSQGLTLKEEVRFDENRKFRFDFVIEELKIAVEYEGLFSQKSRHTTPKGYTKDTEKYNLAQSQGWRIIRVTAINYKTIIYEIEKLYKGESSKD